MVIKMSGLELYLFSSMTKAAPGYEPKEQFTSASALYGERFFFQIGYRLKETQESQRYYKLTVDSGLDGYIGIKQTGLVPVSLPCFSGSDEDYLTKTPCLLPDTLTELPLKNEVLAVRDYMKCLWICVDLTCAQKPAGGVYPLRFRFELSDMPEQKEIPSDIQTAEFILDIIPAQLTEQTLIYTQWFHSDCLATYYKTEVFSERHWEIIENYMACAANHGQNMILTPVVTPALDTAIGTQRPAVQLVDIEVKNGIYSFGFEKLGRWIKTAQRRGIKYFEIAHLFTQWGALHAPKIMAEVSGEYKQIFGWETDASCDEYTAFVKELLTALSAELRRLEVYDNCLFHVSDEPQESYADRYMRRTAVIGSVVPKSKITDALSHFDFYSKGILEKPIPAIDHIGPFIENNVKGLWTYYCCGQGKKVSNRFIAMPGARTRIIGLQFFKYEIEGFLQWGYNFWYSHLSKYPINPYVTTDADGIFPAGDAFTVYPGDDGKPVESMRQALFEQAISDMRACETLASKIGREAVIELISGGVTLTFDEYPKDENYILSVRDKINRKIGEIFTQ